MTRRPRSFGERLALFSTLVVFVMVGVTGCGGPQGANTNTVATPVPTATTVKVMVDCAPTGPTSNEEIVKALYTEISKTHKETWKFNINSEKPDLTIIGWSEAKDDILDIIRNAAPACNVDDKQFFTDASDVKPPYERQSGCPPDYKPCVDLCIPKEQMCAFAGESLKVPATPSKDSGLQKIGNTNTNASSPGNANTSVNTNNKKAP